MHEVNGLKLNLQHVGSGVSSLPRGLSAAKAIRTR